MPCRDGGPDSYYSYEDPAQRRRADKLARIACELARFIDGPNSGPYTVASVSFSKETIEWWRQHKKADAAREEREAKAKRIKQIKEAAIKKLTPEERKALGL